MSKNYTPNLFSIIDHIEYHHNYIVKLWIESDRIESVFRSLNISTSKFEKIYASLIVEYFIAVIKNERESGSCPIMHKLVHFLLKRGVTPKDIFDICRTLKDAFLHSIFQVDTVKENPVIFLDETSLLFDNNLSTLLGIFTSEYKKLNYTRHEHKTIKDFYTYLEFEHILGEMQREARKHATKLALIIVDVAELQKINEEQGFEAADLVLEDVANDIRLLVQENIKIARLEGSRFGLVVPYTSEQECYNWCNALNSEFNKKPERKILSLTSIDSSEKINRAFMRVYDLADIQNESMSIRTDFQNIEIKETLPYQRKIIAILITMAKVHLSLYYKELPVSSDAKVDSYDDETVTVEVSAIQIAAAKHNKYIYFDMPTYGNIKAVVHIVDIEKNLLKIEKFRLDKYSPLQRQKIRVKVKNDISARLVSGGPFYETKVVDMNEEAIALTTPRRGNLQEGSSVSLAMELSLQEKEEEFHSNAVVYRVEKIKGVYKVVVVCQAESENIKLLNNYIAKRQMEIIKELKIL